MLSKPLRIAPTPVPSDTNTHMCFGIYLPDDVISAYDQLPIAVQPYLDNTVIMHHINIWPCREIPSIDLYDTYFIIIIVVVVMLFVQSLNRLMHRVAKMIT